MANFLNPTPSVGAAGTQTKRMWNGIYTASVVSTQDPLKKSRVTLLVPQVLGTAVSDWAIPIGYEPVIPAVNQIVWAMFLGGDINQPLYLYASTINTTTAVPGLPTTPVVDSVILSNSTITGTAKMNTSATSQSSAATFGTSTTGSGTSETIDTSMTSAASTGLTDTAGISLASSSADGSTSNAGGSLSYTLAAGGTVNPISWGATGANVIGSIAAASPTSSTSTPLTADPWHTASLLNSWTGSGTGVNGLFYRLTPFNHVEIIADIINTTATGNSFCFILPSGYIPVGGLKNFPAGWNNPVSSNSASAPWVIVVNTGVIQITGIEVANKQIFFHIFAPLDL